jgi:hypothetical protein
MLLLKIGDVCVTEVGILFCLGLGTFPAARLSQQMWSKTMRGHGMGEGGVCRQQRIWFVQESQDHCLL